MNVLAIIPARGGSKGVPKKNLRLCAGKPLLVWSIEAALACKRIGMVVVSSDDAEILETARRVSPQVVAQERPAELATDEAATDPVLVHVVQNLAGYRPDLVVLLQPTVPVRRPGLIDECIRRQIDTGADSVLTAYLLHFVWWREDDYQVGAGPAGKRWATQCPRRPRRQDMHARERMHHEDGSVYVTRVPYLLEHGSRLGGRIEVVETTRTVDIDTAEDFAQAEALLLARLIQEAVA